MRTKRDEERRLAMRCLKKAMKHLRAASGCSVFNPEWDMHIELFHYFWDIYSAHNPYK